MSEPNKCQTFLSPYVQSLLAKLNQKAGVDDRSSEQEDGTSDSNNDQKAGTNDNNYQKAGADDCNLNKTADRYTASIAAKGYLPPYVELLCYL